MGRFRFVVAVIGFVILVAVGSSWFPRTASPPILESDPTMPSALTVGTFGFDSGDADAPEAPPSSAGASGTGCLFLKQSLCEHPVAIDSDNLWKKGIVTFCSIEYSFSYHTTGQNVMPIMDPGVMFIAAIVTIPTKELEELQHGSKVQAMRATPIQQLVKCHSWIFW